jgi:hypothetical protein
MDQTLTPGIKGLHRKEELSMSQDNYKRDFGFDNFLDACERANQLKDRNIALHAALKKADEIILNIHAEITTFSKYTASLVYECKDIRGDDGSDDLKEFDDNGRDEL